jgi:hypothetical protein
MPGTVLQLDNDLLSVAIHEDASAAFLDRATGERWEMGPVALQEEGPIDIGHVWPRSERSICEQFPGRFRVAAEGEGLRVMVLGREREPVGSFRLSVALDGAWVRFTITDIEEDLPSLVFPTPIVSESLVLPRGVGQWVRTPMASRYFLSFYGQLNMRWFGGLRGDRGWIGIFDEGHEDGGVMATGLSLSPGWLKSLGRWGASRTVSYRFVTGGYVGLAKAYRSWAVEKGLHRSLAEKMDEVPALRNLLGGRILSFMQASPTHAEPFVDRLTPVPDHIRENDGKVRVHYSHADTRQAIQESLQAGLKSGLAVARGWIKGGYDDSHPDIWPPEEAVGSLEDFQALCQNPDPVPVALHDNYQDIYQQSASWPAGVIRTKEGKPMPGGLWAGGQAYILNSRDGLAAAKRNWEQIRTLGTRGMFPDTVTAVRLYESWEAGNELTRAQDEALKTELLEFYRAQGILLGSEEAADFGMPYVHWLENRHVRVAGESVPLWPLVFGDSAFHGRYAHGAVLGEPEPRWKTDMLWGYVLLWNDFKAEGWQERFRATLPVDQWHARVGGSEMVSHRYVTEDGQVERTEFASGCAITVNFGLSEQDGLEPGGYRREDL